MQSFLDISPGPGPGSFLLDHDDNHLHLHHRIQQQLPSFLRSGEPEAPGNGASKDDFSFLKHRQHAIPQPPSFLRSGEPEANGSGVSNNYSSFLDRDHKQHEIPLAASAMETGSKPTIPNHVLLSEEPAALNRTDSFLDPPPPRPRARAQPHSSIHTNPRTTSTPTKYNTPSQSKDTLPSSAMTDEAWQVVPPHRKHTNSTRANTNESSQKAVPPHRKHTTTNTSSAMPDEPQKAVPPHRKHISSSSAMPDESQKAVPPHRKHIDSSSAMPDASQKAVPPHRKHINSSSAMPDESQKAVPPHRKHANASSATTDASHNPAPPHRKHLSQAGQSALSSDSHVPSHQNNEILRKKLFDVGASMDAPKPAMPMPAMPMPAMPTPSSSKPATQKPATSFNTKNPRTSGAQANTSPWKPSAEAKPKIPSKPNTDEYLPPWVLPAPQKAPKSSRGRWAKKSDFPKPDPKRHQTDWTCQPEQEFNWASEAGGGWDTGNQDAGAGDWNQLSYPPLDWESRSAFRPCQSVEKIDHWLQVVDVALRGASPVPLGNFETVAGVTYVFGSSDGTVPDNANTVYERMGDVVPYYWCPGLIDGLAPQTFWYMHIRSENPLPDDGDDLTTTKPWWELVMRGSTFMREPVHPPSNGIDPSQEDEEQRTKRSCDEGSASAAERRVKYEQAKVIAKRERRRIKEENLKKFSNQPLESDKSLIADNRFKPQTKFKLLIRPAQEKDMRDVRDLYNWYIDNSCVVPEIDRCTTDAMLQRLADIRTRTLPFLVACEPGGPFKGKRKGRRLDDEPIIIPDKIVGFAFADDYNCPMGIYRFTVEMEVYVKWDTYGQTIGKCLTDKLMAMLDPGYLERGNYPISEELQNVSPVRLVKNIIINMPYDNYDKFLWKAKWLENWLGFKQEVDMADMGNKGGKAVNLAIFKRSTAAELNHAEPPVMAFTRPRNFF